MPFRSLFAKIDQFKRVADQSTGRGRDDNLVSGGQSLADARRDCGVLPTAATVWVALDSTWPPATTIPVAIPTPTCKGMPAAVVSFGTPRPAQGRLDCALGVMLVRLRITEIGQHAVSRVVGDVAMVAFDDIRAASVTSGRHLPEVFEIEVGSRAPPNQSRRKP